MEYQTIKSWGLCFILAGSVGLTGCNKDDKPKPKEYAPLSGFAAVAPLKIVNSEGEALAGAQVLIGNSQGEFEGNYGTADGNGEFMVPAGWTFKAPVTFDAPGYVRATYMDLAPEGRTIVLTKKFASEVELKGVTTGHTVADKDGFIDLALVMSGMTRQDLLNFQVQKVLSPVSDTIKVVGQEMSLPSNVSLPRQSERYFIVNVTLDKPQYRLYFKDKGVQRVFAARARFPFKDVVDDMRGGKEIFELINYFTIRGGSIRDVNLVDATNRLDIPVRDLNFTEKRAFKAPALNNNQVLVALPVSDNNGYLIPTDLKRLSSGQTAQLNVWNENPMYLAQVIKNKNEFAANKPGMDRLSAILLPFDNNVRSDYLPLIADPKSRGDNTYTIPAVQSDLNKLTTYALISDLSEKKNNKGEISKSTSAAWEIYAPGWVSEITLPNWELKRANKEIRFEVSLVGSMSDENLPLGPQMMEKATHVTHSSLDH